MYYGLHLLFMYVLEERLQSHINKITKHIQNQIRYSKAFSPHTSTFRQCIHEFLYFFMKMYVGAVLLEKISYCIQYSTIQYNTKFHISRVMLKYETCFGENGSLSQGNIKNTLNLTLMVEFDKAPNITGCLHFNIPTAYYKKKNAKL